LLGCWVSAGGPSGLGVFFFFFLLRKIVRGTDLSHSRDQH